MLTVVSTLAPEIISFQLSDDCCIEVFFTAAKWWMCGQIWTTVSCTCVLKHLSMYVLKPSLVTHPWGVLRNHLQKKRAQGFNETPQNEAVGRSVL